MLPTFIFLEGEAHQQGVAEFLVVLLLLTLVLFGVPLFVLQKAKGQRSGNNNIDSNHCSDSTNLTAHNKRQQQAQEHRKLDFLQRVQDEYGYASSKAGFIDTWRSRELPRLIHPIKVMVDDDTSTKEQQTQDEEETEKDDEEPREVYLDFAGAGLPWQSQLQRLVQQDFQVLGNPHSTGPAASRTARFMEQAKKRIGDLFEAHPSLPYLLSQPQKDNTTTITITTTTTTTTQNDSHDDIEQNRFHPGYDIIFTTGTTDALRIVAECFPWKPAAASSSCSCSSCSRGSSKFVYPMQSHTSVIGMRGPAMQAGATFECQPLNDLLKDILNCNHDDDDDDEDRLYLVDHDDEECENSGGQQPQQCMCHKHRGNHEDDSSTAHAEDVDIDHGTVTMMTIPHLLALPLECNFGGARISTTTIQAVGQALQRRSSLSTKCTTTCSIASSTRRCRLCHEDAAAAHEWFLLLDLAKAASTGPVNLKQLNPDFACISFYKLFGEPTGLGCLFIKRGCHSSFILSLQNNNNNTTTPSKATTTCTTTSTMPTTSCTDYSYFGGGSVQAVLPRRDFVIRKQQQQQGSVMDDENQEYSSRHDFILSKMATAAASRSSGGGGGTVHYRGIAALLHGFDVLDSLGGMLLIQKHATCLALELVQRLSSLRHANGQNVVQLYGAWAQQQQQQQQQIKDNNKNSTLRGNAVETNDIMPGPTVAFNLLLQDGSFVGYNEVSKLAALNHPYPIQLRTGCFCNPGACQLALGLDDDQVVENFVKHGHSCGDAMDIIDGKPTGAIRASLGKDSIWEEVDALVTFIERLFVSNLNGTAASNGGDDNNNNNNNSNDDRWDAFPRRVVLSELYVFPIKSCAAQKVERWKLDTSPSSGKLLWDREFALVDASGNAMRLQNYPAMALIQPTMNLESRVLTVNAPGKPTLEIQLQEDYLYEQQQQQHHHHHHDRKSTIKVCGKSCRGRVWGDVETSQWFSEHLGVQCWLARYVSGRYELPLSFLGNRAAPEPPLSSAQHHSDVIAFANEQPILLISENAVDALNEILSEQGQRLVTSKSFRPNMVVRVAGRPEQQSSHAHAEDGWTHVQLINVDNENSNNTGNSDRGFGFDVVGQCARCSMVDVDPSTGLMKGKALRALADYRRSNGQITFGIFLRGAMKEHATTTTTNLETESQTDVWIREGDMLLCQ